MVKLEKILCFIFTLFIVYLVNRHCVVEGIININSFDNCIDDPRWYTLDNDGQKHYCKDIGDTSSCYDMDPLQQEGWERCLKTCGNCADTTVSIAPMDNLAMYSGGNGEDFDRVDIDDSRKWLGVGVGDENNIDVRGTITRDEEDDIVNIFDRLETVEDLYDMLLGSISSCLDCSIYDEDECTQIDNCMVQGTECVTKESTTDGSFISCNGSELGCTYTIKDIEDTDTSDASSPTIENVNSTNKVRTYVKQKCETDGECSILFPTYEFNCGNIPLPDSSSREFNKIKYEPKPAEQRWCLKPAYLNTDSNVSNIFETINSIESTISELQSNNTKIRTSDSFRIFKDSKNLLINAIRSGINYGDKLTETNNNLDIVITDPSNSDPSNSDILTKLISIRTNLGLLNISDTTLLSNLSTYDEIYNNNITPLLSPYQHDCVIDTQEITDGTISVTAGTNSVTITNNSGETINDWTSGEIIDLVPKDGGAPGTGAPGSGADGSVCVPGIKIDNVGANGELTLSTTELNNVLGNYGSPNEQGDQTDVNDILATLSSVGNQGSVYTEITNDGLLNLQNNCNVNRPSTSSVINKCYKLDQGETMNSDGEYVPSLSYESCANYCVGANDETNYISVYNNQDDYECRCFKELLSEDTDDNLATQLTAERCSSNTSELLDKGVTIDVQHIPIAGVDPNDEIRKNCKSYFLLEKTLTREDIDEDDEDRDDIISNIDNMSDRISLYDVCPTQCNAVGCV